MTRRSRGRKAGAHRRPRKRRSLLTRTVAASGAALCIGAVYELGAPTAEALSILLPGRTVDGVSNATRINILEGNIFNPQFGFGGTTSNNTTFGNFFIDLGNNIINQLWSQEIRLFGATGNGNVTQVNILSYNIFNPQISLGRNVSNNTTVNNVAAGNGNHSNTEITTAGGMLPWFGATGNGNTVQFSFFSGNIFNPQWGIGGNESNNTAITNVAIGNGNYSVTTVGFGGWFGTFLMGSGNGNTLQFGFFVSNIWNPQFTFGGGNISHNTAITNTSSGNGNNSSNNTSGGIGVGTTGNGNSNQGAVGSGNIYNDQYNIGPNPTGSNGSNNQQQGVDPATDTLNNLGVETSNEITSNDDEEFVFTTDSFDDSDLDEDEDSLSPNEVDGSSPPPEIAAMDNPNGGDGDGGGDGESGGGSNPGTGGDSDG